MSGTGGVQGMVGIMCGQSRAGVHKECAEQGVCDKECTQRMQRKAGVHKGHAEQDVRDQMCRRSVQSQEWNQMCTRNMQGKVWVSRCAWGACKARSGCASLHKDCIEQGVDDEE